MMPKSPQVCTRWTRHGNVILEPLPHHTGISALSNQSQLCHTGVTACVIQEPLFVSSRSHDLCHTGVTARVIQEPLPGSYRDHCPGHTGATVPVIQDILPGHAGATTCVMQESLLRSHMIHCPCDLCSSTWLLYSTAIPY